MKLVWRIACVGAVAAACLSLPPEIALGESTSMNSETIGADGARVSISATDEELLVQFSAPNLDSRDNRVFLAFNTHRDLGAAILPFEKKFEGSTVYLPFKADLLLSSGTGTSECTERRWHAWKWSDRAVSPDVHASFAKSKLTFHIPRTYLGTAGTIDFVVYAKDLSQNAGWGRLFGCLDPSVTSGTDDKYIPHYLEIAPADSSRIAVRRSRYNSDQARIRIYQLFVRLFGNNNEARVENGTLQENGVGKFKDINDAALDSLGSMGFTHIWLTGVLQQATYTDYSNIGQPADDPDLLKGIAGSPYAIKDYFDVCPDYAEKPENRIEEFKDLISRAHRHKLKVLIDLVPNHVARSYDSDVMPQHNFGTHGNGGTGDDQSKFFAAQNNFFYLKADDDGPPLRLPTCKSEEAVSPTCKAVAARAQGADDGPSGVRTCDGLFEGETVHGKVTGNNKAMWRPGLDDWYETVKLNYGFDFTDQTKSTREYPNATTPEKPLPDTWKKVDKIVEYWQGLGVDGFRCDMAHMEPPEFWNWAIARARERRSDAVFVAEAYDNDPAKVPGSDPVISNLNGGNSNVMSALLNAGFNAVYDDPTYRILKKIYEGPAWANDLDGAFPDGFIFDNSLRYAENHDEVRLAAPSQWGGIGMSVGRPVAAILYGLSRGAIMVYNGQEVGEPGAAREGFGSDDSRTSIFDYWSMPQFVKWNNGWKYDGAKLSPEQAELRAFYGRLVTLAAQPAFRDGEFVPLNAANNKNLSFGATEGETAGGRWMYAFLRVDQASQTRFLVVVNLHKSRSFKDVKINIPAEALRPWRDAAGADQLKFTERLGGKLEITVPWAEMNKESAVPIPEVPPLTAFYFEISG